MYAVADDIKSDFKDIVFDNDSVVTPSLVDEWISQETAYINASIAQRYKIPVIEADSPISFLLLKRICIFRVALRVKNKIEIRSDASDQNSEEKIEQNYVRTPNDDLRMIAKGTLILPDAVSKSSDLGVSSFTSKKGKKPFFNVCEQQW